MTDILTGQILLQIIVILIVIQLIGSLCRRIGLQWVIGEILTGLALGPSFLGGFLPGTENFIFPISTLPVLQTLGTIGLVIYMFSLGTHIDIQLMRRRSRTAIFTSISGIMFPLAMGMVLAFFLFSSFGGPKAILVSFMLMVGTALSITAFPVLARFLTERKLLETRIGTFALTCAAVDDIIAWCLLAFVIAVAHAQGLLSVVLTVGLTLLFIGCMLTIIRPFVVSISQYIPSKQVLAFFSIVMLLLSAYFTYAIGIHPAFGAFLMGIILPRKVIFVELTDAFDRLNSVLLLPLYFVYSGLHTQIGLINTPWLWLICLLTLVIACVSKISGGALVMRFVGESWHDALTLGTLMNTRGLVELIVLNIGRDLGILSSTMFAILVVMALVTTMMTTPLLSLLDYKQKNKKSSDDET